MSCADCGATSGAGRLPDGNSRTTNQTIKPSSPNQNSPIISQAPGPIPPPYQPIIVLHLDHVRRVVVLTPSASPSYPKIPAPYDKDSTKIRQAAAAPDAADLPTQPLRGGVPWFGRHPAY